MSKKIQVSIYLSLKDKKISDCVDTEDIKKGNAKEIPLNSKQGLTGKAYLGVSQDREPDWLPFLKTSATGQGKEIIDNVIKKSKSYSGVVVFENKSINRCFIICLGHGKKFLKSDSLERNFGRNVVLNTADEKKIISIRTMSYEGQPWFNEMQSLLSTDLYQFDINCQYELLQKVAADIEGKLPKEFIQKHGNKQRELISHKLAGYECVHINVDFDDIKIDELFKWLFKQFSSTRYKELIPNVDVFDSVKSEEHIKELDSQLIKLIKANDAEDIYLIVPEKKEVEDIDEYEISIGRTAMRTPYLRMSEITEHLSNNGLLGHIDIDVLKRMKVRGIRADEVREKWPFYKCLTAEINEKDSTYLLFNGSWFKLDDDFFKKTVKKLNSKISSEITFVDYDKSTHKDEGGYNTAMSKEEDITLFDKKLVKASMIGQHIEPCDLLYKTSNFAHIKRLKGSASLSHLFNQGIVANELFLRDEEFKSNFLKKVHDSISSSVKKTLDKKEYTITFGIIIENKSGIDPKKGIRNIPAFSVISLSKAIEVIEAATSVNVQVQFIKAIYVPKPKVITKKKS